MEPNQTDNRDHTLLKSMIEVEVFPNLSTQIIVTTEDRLKLNLNDFITKVKKKNDWITPAGLLLTIVIVFVTSEFKKFIVEANVWEAIFIIAGLFCLIWLIMTIKQSLVKTDVNDLINKLKTEKKKGHE